MHKLSGSGKGLRELGQKHLQNICIFADTKAEWMITAQVCVAGLRGGGGVNIFVDLGKVSYFGIQMKELITFLIFGFLYLCNLM